MPVIEKKKYPLMSEGQHSVTITKVEDLGICDTLYGKKPQIYLEFSSTSGESIRKYYTASVAEKSNLYKDVKAFTGKAPVSPFDTDSLKGLRLGIIVSHEENQKGEQKAKIVAFLKGTVVSAPPSQAASVADQTMIQDSDIPF